MSNSYIIHIYSQSEHNIRLLRKLKFNKLDICGITCSKTKKKGEIFYISIGQEENVRLRVIVTVILMKLS